MLWGSLHGLFVALEKSFPRLLSKPPRCAGIACTFILVNALWVLRAESFPGRHGLPGHAQFYQP
ncbi:MAG: hypothetical protein V8T45_02075 [Oscillospiraceae bacterium]